MTADGVAWLSAGICMGLSVLGTGLAIGHLAGKSVDAVARQPEAQGGIQRLMILGIAFIEALCLYALVVAFMLVAKG